MVAGTPSHCAKNAYSLAIPGLIGNSYRQSYRRLVRMAALVQDWSTTTWRSGGSVTGLEFLGVLTEWAKSGSIFVRLCLWLLCAIGVYAVAKHFYDQLDPLVLIPGSLAVGGLLTRVLEFCGKKIAAKLEEWSFKRAEHDGLIALREHVADMTNGQRKLIASFVEIGQRAVFGHQLWREFKGDRTEPETAARAILYERAVSALRDEGYLSGAAFGQDNQDAQYELHESLYDLVLREPGLVGADAEPRTIHRARKR